MTKVDEYINNAPECSRKHLMSLRQLIKKLVPEAQESFSYGMPAYFLNKLPLLYFAGYSKHIGLYATPEANKQFSKALLTYKTGKGLIRFPLTEPLPLVLIKEIILFKQKSISANSVIGKK